MQGEPTVYIVDDDDAVRQTLGWLIESVGLNVESYGSGQEFLDSWDNGRHGCVVLDVRMPGMSGVTLLEKFRERGVDIPVIVITGHADVTLAVRSMRAGALDFLEKPFSQQLLLDRIQEAIGLDDEQRKAARQRAELQVRLDRLSPREREVMELVVQGRANKEIASALTVSEKTVEVHRSRVMKKLEATSVAHLVRIALAANVISTRPSSEEVL